MSARGRAPVFLATAAACAALALPETARGQKRCTGIQNCAERYGDSVRLWVARDLKTYERAVRHSTLNMSEDSCAARDSIFQKMKEAAKSAFAAANDDEAPRPEWFFWADQPP